MSDYKRSGGRWWRLKVHGARRKGEEMYGRCTNVASHRSPLAAEVEAMRQRIEDGLPDELKTVDIDLPNTDFDELVVGHWCHIEQMSVNTWWMDLGGIVLFVTTDKDGHPKRVSVYGPGQHALPVEGCTYTLNDAPLEDA